MGLATPLYVLGLIALGAAVGSIARLLLFRWAPDLARFTSLAQAVVVGMLGSVIGDGAATLVGIARDSAGWFARGLLALLAAVFASLLGLWVVARVTAARRERPADDLVEEALRDGESARVEFKSTARFNRHTKAKDPRLERVVAKTVAAFANSDGGLLLIGVDDTGTVLGLADDMALSKLPDLDRFHLYLQDMLERLLGRSATARLRVEFVERDGQAVCLVRVPPSPRPVFVAGSGDDLAEFWVRSGNSSRRLGPADMLDYCRGHRLFSRR